MVVETIIQQSTNIDVEEIAKQFIPDTDKNIIFSENLKQMTINLQPTEEYKKKLNVKTGCMKLHFYDEEKIKKAMKELKEVKVEEGEQRCSALKEMVINSNVYGIVKVTQLAAL